MGAGLWFIIRPPLRLLLKSKQIAPFWGFLGAPASTSLAQRGGGSFPLHSAAKPGPPLLRGKVGLIGGVGSGMHAHNNARSAPETGHGHNDHGCEGSTVMSGWGGSRCLAAMSCHKINGSDVPILMKKSE